jgi:hypothetical protein
MKRSNRKVLQVTSAAAVLVGALFLGSVGEPAAQVFAGFCSASEQRYCTQYCEALYGPFGALARCTKYSTGSTACTCQPV